MPDWPQLYDHYYGQDLAIGTGYIDAKYPGAQSLAEKTLKMQMAARQGRGNFPVGLLAGGKRFCPVEAVAELEIAAGLHHLHAAIDTEAGRSRAGCHHRSRDRRRIHFARAYLSTFPRFLDPQIT